ncbi:hypothetical protein NE237_029852 [Protea cynaroides]|uniref:Uncharacterized protein n=1 Tax=Protea cynaroides TaxID=273540 RepID=A0A9Q0GV17_9MAGN|nr:hypothetical protein NE237_029852 [Protea cynaroides]
METNFAEKQISLGSCTSSGSGRKLSEIVSTPEESRRLIYASGKCWWQEGYLHSFVFYVADSGVLVFPDLCSFCLFRAVLPLFIWKVIQMMMDSTENRRERKHMLLLSPLKSGSLSISSLSHSSGRL